MKSLRQYVTVRQTAALAGLAALALGLSACSGDTTAEATESATTATSAASAAQATSDLVLEDGWAKAAEGMTGVFGTLKNNTDGPLTVTGGTSPVAGKIETHTMESKDGAMVMVLDADGFDIPAGGTHKLAPGADHIMLMELKESLVSGSEVTFTLTTKEGTQAEITVPVREFSGADEEYAPGETGHGTSGHTMGEDSTMTHSGSMTMTPGTQTSGD